MIQTMFTCWNFTMSGNGIIVTTISTVDLVSAITTRSKGSEKGQKSGTNRWRRIYRISFLDLSSCPSGASHFTFEFIRTGHRNLLFDRSPSSPSPPSSFRIPVAPVLFFSRKDHGTSSLCQVQCHRFSYLALLLFLSLTRYLFPPLQYPRLNFILLCFPHIFFFVPLHFYLILQFLCFYLFILPER